MLSERQRIEFVQAHVREEEFWKSFEGCANYPEREDFVSRTVKAGAGKPSHLSWRSVTEWLPFISRLSQRDTRT